ncbi:hypothetical protein COV15_01045 [Candidatus Woesearchaeota archaeon CG10_big_fil_rev_8_21_14_0_10_34_12]|nr:MAG: hypothetical protein COV15_01045 [Candidatus Woesearchaeota archaeon CG10_big_fil_rev_8_21_14_0_10_34_12]
MREQILKALEELRKNPERKFNQSVDLIINLKSFNPGKENINVFIPLKHKVKDKKLCAFLTKKSSVIDTIQKPEFVRFKDKKEIKNLVGRYDFFISHASLMPAVATTFGKFLGQAGKMPSPKLGILTDESEESIKKLMEMINKNVRVKTKEASIKLCVGKEKMKDEEIADNILAAYGFLTEALPKKKENVKNIMVKFTMTKPSKIA